MQDYLLSRIFSEETFYLWESVKCKMCLFLTQWRVFLRKERLNRSNLVKVFFFAGTNRGRVPWLRWVLRLLPVPALPGVGRTHGQGANGVVGGFIGTQGREIEGEPGHAQQIKKELCDDKKIRISCNYVSHLVFAKYILLCKKEFSTLQHFKIIYKDKCFLFL